MKKYFFLLIFLSVLNTGCEKDLEIKPKNLDKIDSTFISKINKDHDFFLCNVLIYKRNVVLGTDKILENYESLKFRYSD